MEETPREPPLQPGERVEHREVTERVSPGREVPARRGTPMWVWLLPLVLVAVFLAWYVLTTGEPSSPMGGADRIEIDVPEVELPNPSVENTTIIEVPDAPAPAAEAPAEQN